MSMISCPSRVQQWIEKEDSGCFSKVGLCAGSFCQCFDTEEHLVCKNPDLSMPQVIHVASVSVG